MREVNATSPRHIGTNSMKHSVQKLLETSFFPFQLIIGIFSQTRQSVDLGFFPEQRDIDASCSTEEGIADILCKIQKSAVLDRLGKKMVKMT